MRANQKQGQVRGKLGDVLNLQTYSSKNDYFFAFASFSQRITALPTDVTD